jgi:hypothetical protein
MLQNVVAPHLEAPLGVTKFISIITKNLVTFSVLLKSDVQQTYFAGETSLLNKAHA